MGVGGGDRGGSAEESEAVKPVLQPFVGDLFPPFPRVPAGGGHGISLSGAAAMQTQQITANRSMLFENGWHWNRRPGQGADVGGGAIFP